MRRRKSQEGPSRSRSRTSKALTILIDAAPWRTSARSLKPRLVRAVDAALLAAGVSPGEVSLTLLLSDDEKLRDLNATFRGKNKPTNVLSFPAQQDGESYLGDIAIAHGVAAREAETAQKPLSDHVLHLAVHGVLHLLGHDHENERDAEKMEGLETAILSGLGIADPYSHAKAA